MASWKQFLDGDSSAWDGLRRRIRQPVLLELRRHIDGLRKTEEMADDFCDRLGEDVEERTVAVPPTLREAVSAGIARRLQENVTPDFDADWASSLLLRALARLRQKLPRTQSLLLRIYDRPDGAAPLSAPELARKLDLPEDAVRQSLEEGRNHLRRLFEEEVANTVAGLEPLEAELARLLPHTRDLFA